MFKISDHLRDDVLPHLNILLEDRKPGEASIWKFVDKETIMKEREAKAQAKIKKEQEKIAKIHEDEVAEKETVRIHNVQNMTGACVVYVHSSCVLTKATVSCRHPSRLHKSTSGNTVRRTLKA